MMSASEAASVTGGRTSGADTRFSGVSRAFAASRALSSTWPDWAKRRCASL